jgi:hypothetical protein
MLRNVGSTRSGTNDQDGCGSEKQAGNGYEAKNNKATVRLGLFGRATELPLHGEYQQPSQKQYSHDDEHIAPNQFFHLFPGTKARIHPSPPRG